MYDKVAELMKKNGLRISDVARATGVPYSTFTDWKAGRYVPKYDKLQKIADFFGVSVDYLLSENPDTDDAPVQKMNIPGIILIPRPQGRPRSSLTIRNTAYSLTPRRDPIRMICRWLLICS